MACGRLERLSSRRDRPNPPRSKTATRLLVRLLKKKGLAPNRIITDKLRLYGAARRDVMPGVGHRSHKGLYNRAENSHMPLRIRVRVMQGFRSAGGSQRFISVFSSVRNLFMPPHHPRHPHSSHPRNSALERRDRRNCVSSSANGLSGIRRTT